MAPNPEMEEKIVGGYKLRRFLGKGGMGLVWLATKDGPDGFSKNVVVKKLKPEAAAHLQNFVIEARVGGRLNHPNLVGVLELLTDSGENYLVMEYVEGVTLEELTDNEKLTVEEAVNVATQMLNGLFAFHNLSMDGNFLGAVHRDVSPDNTLLDVHGVVKMTDYGIAKFHDLEARPETESKVIKGKYLYLSPEVLEHKPFDLRVDIYATGLVLYETLTGQKALSSSRSTVHMLARILEGDIPPIRKINPKIPKKLAEIVHRMIALDPNQRFATAADAREALLRAVPQCIFADRTIGDRVRKLSMKLDRRSLTSPYLAVEEKIQLMLREKLEAAKQKKPVAGDEKTELAKANPDEETLKPGVQAQSNGKTTEPDQMVESAHLQKVNIGNLALGKNEPTLMSTREQEPSTPGIVARLAARARTVNVQVWVGIGFVVLSFVLLGVTMLVAGRRQPEVEGAAASTVAHEIHPLPSSSPVAAAAPEPKPTPENLPAAVMPSAPSPVPVTAVVAVPPVQEQASPAAKPAATVPALQKTASVEKTETAPMKHHRSSAEMGTLVVPAIFTGNSVTVKVDGVMVGRAPLSRRLAPGKHKIDVHSKDMDFYNEVTFEAGKQFAVDLNPHIRARRERNANQTNREDDRLDNK